MRYALLLVLLVVACDRATAPEPFTLGPGCVHSKSFPVKGGTEVATLKAYYSDCTKQNVDSLRAAGWVVEWDRHPS